MMQVRCDECPPLTGFVVKYGQKLNTFGGNLVTGNLREGSCSSSQECGTSLFGAFPLFREALSGSVLARQEWGFSVYAGMSWSLE